MKKKITFLFFINLFFICKIFALPTFGHNLSPTTHSLKENQVTFGSYLIGYGLTDHLLIATSPWIYSNYNMSNLALKYTNSLNDRWNYVSQTIYFKTFNGFSNRYKMESIMTSLGVSTQISKDVEVTFNFNYMFYWDETLPFSLRRETLNDQPYQYNFTALFEFMPESDLGVLIELGALGINYKYPQVISGFSVHYKMSHFLIQLGISITGTPKSYFNSTRYDYNQHKISKEFIDEESVKRDFSIHPEIQLQYFF